jgi:hypothetical protein
MPRLTPQQVKNAALGFAMQEGFPIDMVVDEIETRFDANGNLKTDQNIPGYRLAEKTVKRWLDKEGWPEVDVSSYPMGAVPHPDADISRIKDAVTHFSVNAAMDAVAVRDSPGRRIKDTVHDVLQDVVLNVRPRNQRVLEFLAQRFLPAYIRATRKSHFKNPVLLTAEDQAMIDEALKEVNDE